MGRTWAAIILVAAAMTSTACSGDAPSCETAIRKAMKATGDSSSDEAVAQIVGVCIKDHWSARVRSCLGNASTKEGAAACLRKLDEADDEPRRGRRSEAELNLNAINKAADAEFSENASYPVGSAELTPSRSCCDFPDKKCPADSKDWVGNPVWDALGFEMTQPSYFRYSYTGTATSFEATAVGDLDCDGNSVTYTLRGDASNGSPTSTLTKPARAD